MNGHATDPIVVIEILTDHEFKLESYCRTVKAYRADEENNVAP